MKKFRDIDVKLEVPRGTVGSMTERQARVFEDSGIRIVESPHLEGDEAYLVSDNGRNVMIHRLGDARAYVISKESLQPPMPPTKFQLGIEPEPPRVASAPAIVSNARYIGFFGPAG